MSESIDRAAKLAIVSPERYAAIKARAEAATPGPWVVRHIGNSTRVGIEYSSSPTSLTGSLHDYDAEFIAHAREDIPALLAALEEAEAERDDLDALARVNAMNMSDWLAMKERAEEAERAFEDAEMLLAERTRAFEDAVKVANAEKGKRLEAERERDVARARTRGVLRDYEAELRRADNAEVRAEEAERRIAAVEAEITAWEQAPKGEIAPVRGAAQVFRAALHPVAETTESEGN